MKFFYNKICRPLMLINYNVYTFISGIILSLSTGIFTTLCLERVGMFAQDWHLYVSTVLYLISGALCIYIATKLTPLHDYVQSGSIPNTNERYEIVDGVFGTQYKFWVAVFAALILTLIGGTVFMALNFFIAG